MNDETKVVRALAVEEIANVMAEAGEGREMRRAAALRGYPEIPATILAAAERHADQIAEERFLEPLKTRFADRLAKMPASEQERLLKSSSSHLDEDVPF